MSNQKPIFSDPVAEIAERDRLRTSIVYDRRVVGFLGLIHCRKGTEQITTNILLAKLKDELERNGINSYDPDAYELAVTTCTIRLAKRRGARSTTDGTPPGPRPEVPDQAVG